MTRVFNLIAAHGPIDPPHAFPNFDRTLREYLKYLGLKELPLIERQFSDVFSIPTTLGMEIEIENIHRPLSLPEFWNSKPDNSLRNGGMEFFNCPLEPQQAMQATVLFWSVLKKLITSGRPSFSWRTSTQVHVYVGDMAEDELRRFLLLAFVCERLLFDQAGKDREESIFCVPVYQAIMTDKLGRYLRKKSSLHETATTWPKYSAFNLSRMFANDNGSPEGLPALGTVEFRHLGGTKNLLKVLTWQSLILHMFDAAIGVTMDELMASIENLKPSTAEAFLHKVFSPALVEGMGITNYSNVFSDTATRAKELFVTKPKLKEVLPDSAMAKAAIKMYKSRAKPKPKKTEVPF